MDKNIWHSIVNSYTQNPRDVITTPIGKRKGKWFHVNAEENKVYISEAKEHYNSSKFKMKRTLSQKELDEVFELYIKRKNGTANSKEIQEATLNSSYWFGIFNDLHL